MPTMNQIPGIRSRGLQPRTNSATAFCVVMIALAMLGGSRAPAQDVRSMLSPDVPPGIDSFGQPGQPLLSPGTVSADPLDPYAPTEEIGPFEPGLGWTCGGSCPPSWRVRGEWLYFSRNRGNDSFSNGFRFDNRFDFEHTGRVTLDRRYDCTQGWEIVYAGPFNFQEQGAAAGAGTLNADLSPRGINMSAFFGADFQSQRYDSRVYNVEAGYKSWGWNVIGVFIGGRYLNLNDRLQFLSIDSGGDVGFLQVKTNNEMVLGQLGVDMMFPLGRWSFDASAKGAIGATIGTSDVFLSNAGITQINRGDEGLEFAALIESGAYLRYFVTQRLTARIGYEFWWLRGVGLASRQFGSTISPRTARETRLTNELFLYGATAGFEFVF